MANLDRFLERGWCFSSGSSTGSSRLHKDLWLNSAKRQKAAIQLESVVKGTEVIRSAQSMMPHQRRLKLWNCHHNRPLPCLRRYTPTENSRQSNGQP